MDERVYQAGRLIAAALPTGTPLVDEIGRAHV